MISQAVSPTTAAWQPETNVYSSQRILGNPDVHWCFFLSLSVFFLFLLKFYALKWKALSFVTDHSKIMVVELSRPNDYLKNMLVGGVLLKATVFKLIFTSELSLSLRASLSSTKIIFQLSYVYHLLSSDLTLFHSIFMAILFRGCYNRVHVASDQVKLRKDN